MAKLILTGSDAAINRINKMFAGVYKQYGITVLFETEIQAETENEQAENLQTSEVLATTELKKSNSKGKNK